MRQVIEFAGLKNKGGVRNFGRAILEDGKLRVEGSEFLKKFLKNDIRDLRPGRSQKWIDSKKNPELFFRCLSWYYSGTYFCAGRIGEKRRKGENDEKTQPYSYCAYGCGSSVALRVLS